MCTWSPGEFWLLVTLWLLALGQLWHLGLAMPEHLVKPAPQDTPWLLEILTMDMTHGFVKSCWSHEFQKPLHGWAGTLGWMPCWWLPAATPLSFWGGDRVRNWFPSKPWKVPWVRSCPCTSGPLCDCYLHSPQNCFPPNLNDGWRKWIQLCWFPSLVITKGTCANHSPEEEKM